MGSLDTQGLIYSKLEAMKAHRQLQEDVASDTVQTLLVQRRATDETFQATIYCGVKCILGFFGCNGGRGLEAFQCWGIMAS